MKLANKTLNEYLKFSWKYMLVIFIVGLVMFILVQLRLMSQFAYNPIGIVAGLLTFIAG